MAPNAKHSIITMNERACVLNSPSAATPQKDAEMTSEIKAFDGEKSTDAKLSVRDRALDDGVLLKLMNRSKHHRNSQRFSASGFRYSFQNWTRRYFFWVTAKIDVMPFPFQGQCIILGTRRCFD